MRARPDAEGPRARHLQPAPPAAGRPIPPHAGPALARVLAAADSPFAEQIAQLVELYNRGGSATVSIEVAAPGEHASIRFVDGLPIYGLLEGLLAAPEEWGAGDLWHREHDELEPATR
jgi:hypothetical protein